jgi:amino acid transporter
MQDARTDADSQRLFPEKTPPNSPQLIKSLTLTHAVLYGLGVTIGAGIYVLVGVAAGRSGMHAPLAFLAAAIVMGLTAASFAELGTRMPVAASEAAYVQAAFRRKWLSGAVGLLVVGAAAISGATISVISACSFRFKHPTLSPPSWLRWAPLRASPPCSRSALRDL